MNEQLKFSWGHIIAFLALIFLSYVTFVGVTYMTNGNFMDASFAMVITTVLLFIFFIGAQIAKATANKFKRWIIIERLLVFCSPILFILIMIPFAHFWTVHSRNDKIVVMFTQAINASKQMFNDYEDYAHRRIANYTGLLESMAGEDKSYGVVHRENLIHTLELQLLSSNYLSLKVEANKWIDASNNGASTWNVFLLGNIREIKNAIHGWNAQLADYAANRLTNEELKGNTVELFGKSNVSLKEVDEGLDNLRMMFVTREWPPVYTYIIGIVLYFALLFPYFLQERHTKSVYRLVGMKKSISNTSGLIDEYGTDDDNIITDKIRTASSTQNSDGDYTSFTI